MADPNQPQQLPLSPAQASSGTTAGPISKQQTSPQAIARAVIKYDVLPPCPQQAGASTQPNTSSISPAHSSPSTPAGPALVTQTAPSLSTPAALSGASSKIPSSAQLLANARAKLAAAKKATAPSASTPSPNIGVQLFEITYLKTIKCDVCEQKNGELLYKCLNCPGHHQICSRCVESTEPQPAGVTMGRKDWSVHAKLKDAHADHTQPICLSKKEDGSYESNGVKFVLAQGKRSGVKQARKITPKRSVTPGDRNSAVRRAIGGNKTTEQGRRITEMARAKLEEGQDQELRARVAAARARRQAQDEAEGKAQPEARGKAKPEAEEKKRKAAVLDEEDDGNAYVVVDAVVDVEDADEVADGDADGDADDDADEKADEDGDGDETQNDEDDGWDPADTAAALEESVRDIGRLGSDRSKRVRFEDTNDSGLEALSQPHSVFLGFRDASARTHPSSVGRMPPLVALSNQASTNDPFASQDLRTKATQESLPERPPLGSSSQPNRSQPLLNTSEMKITARRSKFSKHTADSSGGMPQPQRDSDPEAESTCNDSSLESIDQDDERRNPEKNSKYGLPESVAPHPEPANSAQEASQKRKKIEAQRELQHMTEEGEEQEDPYAQDALGIGMLLQAAKVIDDQERAEEMQKKGTTQLDGSGSDVPRAPSDQSHDDDERFKDDSETNWLSNRPPPPRVEIPTTPPVRTRPATLAPSPPRGHKRRRSERLAPTDPGLHHRATKRTKSEQPTSNLHTHATTPEPTTKTPIQDATVRQRVKAIADKTALLSRGKGRPTWNPLVKSYLEEQQAKREKTMEWLAQQESSDEEGLDRGVEGGIWVESSGGAAGKEGVGKAEGEGGLSEKKGKGRGGGKEDGGKDVETKDSQDDDDEDTDDGGGGGGGSDSHTVSVKAGPRGRRLIRGHRRSASDESQ